MVPFHNEAKRFDLEYWKMRTANDAILHYLVDDGSRDNTLRLLLNLAEHSPKTTKVVQLPANIGKAEALRHGLTLAFNEYPGIKILGYCDGDTTVLPEDVLRLLNIMKENNYDVILASRVMLLGRKINRAPSRHLIGRIIVTILGLGHNNFPYDPQNGLKLIRNSERIAKSLEKPFRTRWFIDIELMIRIRQQGLTHFWEEPLLYWRESKGSHLSFRSIPRILYEIVIIRRLLKEWT